MEAESLFSKDNPELVKYLVQALNEMFPHYGKFEFSQNTLSSVLFTAKESVELSVEAYTFMYSSISGAVKMYEIMSYKGETK